MHEITDYDVTRAREQSQQLICDQECVDREQSVLEGLVDRNGAALVSIWLKQYQEHIQRNAEAWEDAYQSHLDGESEPGIYCFSEHDAFGEF